MRTKKSTITTSFLIVLLIASTGLVMAESSTKTKASPVIKLPPPTLSGKSSFEEMLQKRRSVREYSGKSLKLNEISQILWAGQGITSPYGMRTAPSAGALYPMELYLLAAHVDGLPKGLYRYRQERHDLESVIEGDLRKALAKAALDQECIRDSAAAIIITAVYERTTIKYRDRGFRYVHMEVGHIAQNIYLQAQSLEVGTVFVGAFHDEDVKKILHILEEPLGIMPVGRIRGEK